MSSALYFTERGYRKQQEKARELEVDLRRLQRQTAHAAEVGGNQYHDNASYEYLVIQIRVADRRLAGEMAILNRAQIRLIPQNPEWAQLGTLVHLTMNGDEKTISIVGYGESDSAVDAYSYESPFAQALIGARPGEDRVLEVNGSLITFHIRSVEPLEEWSR